MNIKIVETNLNLRIERGRERMDYTLTREVAEKQLSLGADVYANVEYMECRDEEYIAAFKKAGYNIYSAVDEPRHRGILYAVKKEYKVEGIASMQEPHMFHVRVSKNKKYIDLITFRVLVAGSNDADFIGRKKQWDTVMKYVDGLEERDHIVLTGDWNHGVIADTYTKAQPRRFFNYQMIIKTLLKKGISLFNIEGNSFKEYMKIDHIASGSDVKITNAVYQQLFAEAHTIGIPDHKLIVAELTL